MKMPKLTLNNPNFYLFQEAEDFLCAEVIQPRNVLIDIPLHGMRLPRACLAIGETRDLGSHERILD